MRDDPLFIVAMIACVAVAAILVLGLAAFTKGGEFNKKYANKLMRYRIGAQFLAVVLILLFVAMRG